MKAQLALALLFCATIAISASQHEVLSREDLLNLLENDADLSTVDAKAFNRPRFNVADVDEGDDEEMGKDATELLAKLREQLKKIENELVKAKEEKEAATSAKDSAKEKYEAALAAFTKADQALKAHIAEYNEAKGDCDAVLAQNSKALAIIKVLEGHLKSLDDVRGDDQQLAALREISMTAQTLLATSAGDVSAEMKDALMSIQTTMKTTTTTAQQKYKETEQVKELLGDLKKKFSDTSCKDDYEKLKAKEPGLTSDRNTKKTARDSAETEKANAVKRLKVARQAVEDKENALVDFKKTMVDAHMKRLADMDRPEEPEFKNDVHVGFEKVGSTEGKVVGDHYANRGARFEENIKTMKSDWVASGKFGITAGGANGKFGSKPIEIKFTRAIKRIGFTPFGMAKELTVTFIADDEDNTRVGLIKIKMKKGKNEFHGFGGMGKIKKVIITGDGAGFGIDNLKYDGETKNTLRKALNEEQQRMNSNQDEVERLQKKLKELTEEVDDLNEKLKDCTLIEDCSKAPKDGIYKIKKLGNKEVKCQRGGWMLIAVLNQEWQGYCAANGADANLLGNPTADAGKILDQDVHKAVPGAFRIKYEVAAPEKKGQTITSPNISSRYTTAGQIINNKWTCGDGSTDKTTGGKERLGCGVIGAGTGGNTKKLYLFGKHGSHFGSLHSGGGFCGLGNLKRGYKVHIWIQAVASRSA